MMAEATVGGRGDASILDRWWRTVDRWLIAAVAILYVIGVVLGFAASPPLAARNNLPAFHYVFRQMLFSFPAFGAMFVMSFASPKTIRRLGTLLFLATALMLALLPVFGTDFGKGAVRWFSLGFISFQPSEFLKPAFAVTGAWLMAGSLERNGPPGKLLSFLLAGAGALVLALQPDFGQATLIMAIWGVMFFIAGASVFWLLGLGGAVAGAGVFAYFNSEHFARRIDAYLSSTNDPRSQLGYAYDAILNGGVIGVGPGEGVVKRLLPDAHTDFIIAVAAEEYGLILCLVIVALFAFVALRAFYRLSGERDPFTRFAGAGLAAMFALQALVNLGVALRLLPAKGMTLPFISYGGSSLLAAGLGMGMLLALTRSRPQHDVADLLGGDRT